MLILSGITHVLQLSVYGTEGHVLGAVAFGILYFFLGILILYKPYDDIITLTAALLPLIGGILGLARLYVYYIKASGEMNWFIIWHVLVDIYVVPISTISYLALKNGTLKHPE